MSTGRIAPCLVSGVGEILKNHDIYTSYMYASLTPPTTQVISVATADEKTLEFKIYQSDYRKQSRVRTRLTHATKYSTESLIRSIFILGNAEDLYAR